jgi:hypothetical protein
MPLPGGELQMRLPHARQQPVALAGARVISRSARTRALFAAAALSAFTLAAQAPKVTTPKEALGFNH